MSVPKTTAPPFNQLKPGGQAFVVAVAWHPDDPVEQLRLSADLLLGALGAELPPAMCERMAQRIVQIHARQLAQHKPAPWRRLWTQLLKRFW